METFLKDINTNVLNFSINKTETDTNITNENFNKTKNSNITIKSIDWNYKLKNSENKDFEITEFDSHKYYFKNVIDPSGKPTAYYTIHCNINNKLDKNDKLIWYTKNANLSKNYVVANLDKLIKYIKTIVNTINDYVYTSSPFVISWQGDTIHSIDSFNNSMDKLIFESITGIDTNIFNNIKNNVRLNILNSYDGKTSVFITFLNSISYINKDGIVKTFTDYFTLSKNTIYVAHKGDLSQINDGLNKLSDIVLKDIEKLKKFKPDNIEKFAESFASKFRGDVKKTFLSNWESLQSRDKNMFYLLTILSKSLGDDYNSKRHLELIYLVNKYIQKIDKWIDENKNI